MSSSYCDGRNFCASISPMDKIRHDGILDTTPQIPSKRASHPWEDLFQLQQDEQQDQQQEPVDRPAKMPHRRDSKQVALVCNNNNATMASILPALIAAALEDDDDDDEFSSSSFESCLRRSASIFSSSPDLPPKMAVRRVSAHALSC